MNIRISLAALSCIALVATASGAKAEPSCAAPPDVEARYGDRIAFDVVREGSKVGNHETRFDREDGMLKVTSEMKLKVKVLFIPVYKFQYEAEEVWCGDSIQALRAKVNDNGDKLSFAADRMADGFVIRLGEAEEVVEADILPTNHWNPNVLDDNTVLNTLTGNVNRVDIINHGEEVIKTGSGEIRATRYEYRGELETEAWYDDAGRWVKLRFEAKDGSTIEYVCTTCSVGTGKS